MLHGLACHAGVRSPGLVSSPPGSSQIDPVPGSTRGGRYKAEPACAWGHHPFLRAADSLGLPSTGSSQPQSPDRGLAGQLLRHSVCRQPAPQPGREALADARPSPADRARKHGRRRGDRLYGSLRLGKLRRRPPRGHAHAAAAILARSRAALPLVYEGVCVREVNPVFCGREKGAKARMVINNTRSGYGLHHGHNIVLVTVSEVSAENLAMKSTVELLRRIQVERLLLSRCHRPFLLSMPPTRTRMPLIPFL